MTKEEITICKMYLDDSDKTHNCNEYKLLMGLLEQQPSDDTVTITMDKGTLKYSGQGYVVYKKDWFKKHFATEVEIMTGYDGYIEQTTSDDCVSRKELLKLYGNRAFELQKTHQTDKQLGINWCINTLNELPPVTPTHGTCKDCNNREDCLIDIDNDFYCRDFEKRGAENE